MSTPHISDRRTFVGAATAAAAAVFVPRVFASDDSFRPSVPYQRFLRELGDSDPTRKEWWERYQKAEQFARQCVGKWKFGKLTSVAFTPNKTLWMPDGTLNVTKRSLASGAIYHELFHPVLHNAPFKIKAEHSRIDYRLYVECLCNAFEYFMEVQLGPKGDWMTRMDKWRSISWAEIIADSGDLGYDMTYGLPALEFIKACRDFDDFKKMVADLNAKSMK